MCDKYADGKPEREFFLNEKKQYGADMKRLEEELAVLRQAQEEKENRLSYGISGRGRTDRGYERQTDRKGRCLSG